MSHYSTCALKVINRDALVEALKDMGFTDNQIEVHDKAQNLHGYQGDTRTQKANVIVRRQYVGGAANDIGFEKLQDGTYQAHISEYDRTNSAASKKNSEYSQKAAKAKRGYNDEWLKEMTQRYARHVQVQVADDIGWELTSEEYNVNGELVIKLVSNF